MCSSLRRRTFLRSVSTTSAVYQLEIKFCYLRDGEASGLTAGGADVGQCGVRPPGHGPARPGRRCRIHATPLILLLAISYGSVLSSLRRRRRRQPHVSRLLVADVAAVKCRQMSRLDQISPASNSTLQPQKPSLDTVYCWLLRPVTRPSVVVHRTLNIQQEYVSDYNKDAFP